MHVFNEQREKPVSDDGNARLDSWTCGTDIEREKHDLRPFGSGKCSLQELRSPPSEDKFYFLDTDRILWTPQQYRPACLWATPTKTLLTTRRQLHAHSSMPHPAHLSPSVRHSLKCLLNRHEFRMDIKYSVSISTQSYFKKLLSEPFFCYKWKLFHFNPK